MQETTDYQFEKKVTAREQKLIKLHHNEELTRDKVLQNILSGQPLNEILDSLCLMAEERDTGLYCSILLTDENQNNLFCTAGPNIPKDYSQQIDGIVICDGVGSCPTAAATREVFIVEDIYSHPNWQDFLSIAKLTDFKSCWSQPFFDSKGTLLGTFAMYWEDIGGPDSYDIDYIKSISRLASVAVEMKRYQDNEINIRHKLEETVELKTKQLKDKIKKVELMQKQLISQEKLIALVNMSSGIAHEIRNPLNLIKNYATTLSENKTLDKDFVKEVSDVILTNSQRIENIVHNMLRQSEKKALESKSINLKELLESAVKNAKDVFIQKYNLPIQFDLKLDNPGHYDFYEDELFRVFVNLFENSFFAMKEKSNQNSSNYTPKLTVSLAVVDRAEIIEIKIKDNGKGISQEDISHIFEPFFTTKQTGQGTGLGLSLVYDIIRLNRGTIEVHSELFQYTEFTIRLSKF